MRHFLKYFAAIVCLLAITNSQAFGQITDKWHGSIEFDPNFSFEKGADPSFNLKLTATRPINEYIGLGAGFGLSESFNFGSTPTIPIFARVNAENYSAKFTPFGRMDIGYSLVTENFGNSGFFFNPVVGVRYGDFSFGVGYHGFKSGAEGSKLSSAFTIHLGYNFGYHKDNALNRFFKALDYGVAFGGKIMVGGNTLNSFYTSDKKLLSGYGIGLSALYPFSDKFSAGLAVGVQILGDETYHVMNMEKYTDKNMGYVFVPVTLRGKYRFREISIANKFYPFAQFDLGVQTGDTGGVSSAFYYSPAVGLSFDTRGGKSSIDLTVGYSPVKWGYTEGPDLKTKTASAIDISLGYTF